MNSSSTGLKEIVIFHRETSRRKNGCQYSPNDYLALNIRCGLLADMMLTFFCGEFRWISKFSLILAREYFSSKSGVKQ